MEFELMPVAEEWDLNSHVGHMTTGSTVAVEEDTSLREAARRMAEEQVGSLVVVGPEGPCAIVTEGDIVRAVADGVDPDRAVVVDVASPDVVAADTDDTVLDVIQMMADYGIRHVPVRKQDAGGNYQLVGMVSSRDIVRGLARRVE